MRCEGFRGVSQSLGHHIANDAIRDWVLPRRDGKAFEGTPYDVAVIGDYNIGGDAWSSRILLEEMGLRVVAQWSGDGTIAEMEKTPYVKMNLIHCYRSMNYIARHMEEKYSIPWMEYNFFGPTKVAESLRAIAAQFDDKIKEGAERVIAKYQPLMQAVIDKYKPRLQGKRVMLYVGGLRPRHVIGAYEDLGMEVVGTGYEFGHNDDYDRTIKDMGNATLLYDDVTGFEFEEFVKTRQARPGRFRHQGKVHLPEDGRSLPPDAQLGLFRPVPRLRRLRHLRPRHGHDLEQPVLGQDAGTVVEEG